MIGPNLFSVISLLTLFSTSLVQVKCLRTRMIGANDTRANEFKYVVSIQTSDEKQLGRCTGGIISEDFIITAAHCVVDKKTKQFYNKRMKVIAGSNDLKNPDNRGIEIPVEAIMVPWSYKPMRPFPSDIALLKLKHPLNLSDERLEKLSLPNIKLKDLENQVFKFTGFGRTDRVDFGNGTYGHTKGNDGKLRQANMKFIEDCFHYWPRKSKTSFCGNMINNQNLEVIGLCHGDSGGPFVLNNTIYGISSYVEQTCNENIAPSVFTNVADFADFIKEALKHGLSERFKKADAAGYF